ncbi:MAG: M28 family peptidase [Ignavibacteria bacterium]
MRITLIVLSSLLLFTLIYCKKKDEPIKTTEVVWMLEYNRTIPNFDENLTYEYILKQLSFGPRNPNSSGHKLAKEFLFNELKKFADTVYFQNFNYPGYDGEILNCSNIIASFRPESKIRILLCAHWDTRPRSDEDKNPENQNKPILGANDGASGVAVLLSLAKILSEHKPEFGIDIVLFDAEDYGRKNDLMNYSLGSKYFIQNKPTYINPQFGILLDMVGDKEAVFKKEPNSYQFAPDVVDKVWRLASELNLKSFSNEFSNPIYDDHIPLGEMGMKIIDIIDADLIGADSPNPRRNYWHTQNDTIENISKETLKEVGKLITTLIYSIKFTER